MLTFKTFLQEGVNDPSIFKAVFLAGGPGSGKSFIANATGLGVLGFKVVNSDDAFEHAMKKAGVNLDPEGIWSAQGQEIRGKAKTLTGKKQEMYIKGRLGLVIDGTGKDIEKMKKQVKEMKKLGYDVAMVFVNTDMDTALKRNRERERVLPDAQVESYWKAIQKNIGAFQQIFGKKNFLVVDNSVGKDYKVETVRAYKDVTKFVKRPLENKKALQWIKDARATNKK